MDSSRRPSHSRLTVPVLAMVAAIAVTAGVGGCAPSRPPRPVTAPAPAPVTAPAPATPGLRARARAVIAQDATTVRWSWLVGRAETQLVAQCMKRHGLSYPVPAADPPPGPATTTVDVLGGGGPATYGITGSTTPPSDPATGLASFQQALEGGPDEDASLTLPDGSTVGYQTGGCFGEVRAQLFGSVRTYVVSAYLPQVVRDQFETSLASDRAYNDALAAWQSCMAQRHWIFKTPGAAIASLETAPLVPAALDRRQTAIAGADRDCDLRSHLRSRRGQALTRFSAGLPAPEVAELDQVSTGRELAGRVALADRKG
jgi:hypothetical protein